MADIEWLRRLTGNGAASLEPPDPAAVEREVYEKLYGEPYSDISVTEIPPEPAVQAGRRAKTRGAPKRAATSRAVS